MGNRVGDGDGEEGEGEMRVGVDDLTEGGGDGVVAVLETWEAW